MTDVLLSLDLPRSQEERLTGKLRDQYGMHSMSLALVETWGVLDHIEHKELLEPVMLEVVRAALDDVEYIDLDI